MKCFSNHFQFVHKKERKKVKTRDVCGDEEIAAFLT